MKFVYIHNRYVKVELIKSINVGETGRGKTDYPYIRIDYIDGSYDLTSFDKETKKEDVEVYLSQIIDLISKKGIRFPSLIRCTTSNSKGLTKRFSSVIL